VVDDVLDFTARPDFEVRAASTTSEKILEKNLNL
jgi:hypothetical protein